MRKERVFVWAGLFVVSFLFALGAKAQAIKEIDTTSGLLVNGGTSATGPTAALSIQNGGIANSSLAHSSVTINTGSGLSGGGAVSLGGSLTLGLVTPFLKSQLPSTTAYTDAANSFTQNQSITGSLGVSGRINLPWTTSSSVGVISLGTDNSGNPLPFIHNFPGNVGTGVVGNTFVGEFAGNFNGMSGTDGNTGLGYAALGAVTSSNADGNTGVGYLALGRTTTGFFNTSLGFQSTWVNTTGVYNVGIGPFALPDNQTGNHNIAVGYDSGDTSNFSFGNGSENIYIGEITGAQLQGESHTIRIGNPTSDGGNHGVQNRTFLAGITGVTVSGSAVCVTSDGQLGICPVLVQLNDTDKQKEKMEAQKEQIQSLQDQLAQLQSQMRQFQLQVVSVKKRAEQRNQIAAIAAQR